MVATNFTGKQTFEELYCSAGLAEETQDQLVYFIAINIFLSISAFLGNVLILVALHRESSLYQPSKVLLRCLATTDLCVGVISEPLHVIYDLTLMKKRWDICPYALFASTIASYTLSGVTLLTMTAISVDRLLVLLLGLKYKNLVTLKRMYVSVLAFWIVSSVAATIYLVNYYITFLYSTIVISLCFVTKTFSYSKIFCSLSSHQKQCHPQQTNQTCRLHMARYRKAVSGALWLQFALALCYVPFSTVSAVGALLKVSVHKKVSSSFFLARLLTITLVYLNSSLNPFLYYWKINSVRRTVKETIRKILCWSSN